MKRFQIDYPSSCVALSEHVKMMTNSPRFQWCTDPSRARELADFFARNVEASYISHSELQGPRALAPDRWRDGLPTILEEEIGPRLVRTQKKPVPSKNSKPILIAEIEGELVGVSFVTFDSRWVPFAVVEDLVVLPSRRNKGIGIAILRWIEAETRARKINRLMLESGLSNHDAHRLFERVGFQVCSKVMMKFL
jgi:GNAT superfamily N-acetyltransferase